jgi:hypothetical protein
MLKNAVEYERVNLKANFTTIPRQVYLPSLLYVSVSNCHRVLVNESENRKKSGGKAKCMSKGRNAWDALCCYTP